MSATQKALPGQVGPLSSDRRDHLKAYLFACVRDNVLKPQDLMSLNMIDKLRQTITSDLKSMVVGAGAGLLKMASMFVSAKLG